MKKILLAMLMSSVAVSSMATAAVRFDRGVRVDERGNRFDGLRNRFGADNFENKENRFEDRAGQAARRVRIDPRIEKAETQKKIFLAIIAALGISYYLGKDTFGKITGKVTTALNNPENPVDHVLGEVVEGLVGKATSAAGTATEKSIQQAQRECEALVVEVRKARGEEKEELQTQLDEAKRKKVLMEYNFYEDAFNKAEQALTEVQAEREELTEQGKDILAAVKVNEEKVKAITKEIGTLKADDGDGKAKLDDELAVVNEDIKALNADLETIKDQLKPLDEEVKVQTAEEATRAPNKRTAFKSAERKFNDVQRAWNKLSPEQVELCREEEEQAKAGKTYVTRVLKSTISKDGDVVRARRNANAALDGDFRDGLTALISGFKFVVGKVAADDKKRA